VVVERKQRIAVVERRTATSGIASALAPQFDVERIDIADVPSMLAVREKEFGACAIDADLPGDAGIALAERLATACPTLPVILFSTALRRRIAAVASRLGVPLLLKPVEVKEVGEALDAVRRRALGYVERELRAEFEATAQHAGLTQQQQSVSLMIVLGAVSKQVADRLGVNVRTVEGHRHQTLKKLQLGTMDDLRWKVLSRVLPDWRMKK